MFIRNNFALSRQNVAVQCILTVYLTEPYPVGAVDLGSADLSTVGPAGGVVVSVDYLPTSRYLSLDWTAGRTGKGAAGNVAVPTGYRVILAFKIVGGEAELSR